jgi:hypothetical protein
LSRLQDAAQQKLAELTDQYEADIEIREREMETQKQIARDEISAQMQGVMATMYTNLLSPAAPRGRKSSGPTDQGDNGDSPLSSSSSSLAPAVGRWLSSASPASSDPYRQPRSSSSSSSSSSASSSSSSASSSSYSPSSSSARSVDSRHPGAAGTSTTGAAVGGTADAGVGAGTIPVSLREDEVGSVGEGVQVSLRPALYSALSVNVRNRGDVDDDARSESELSFLQSYPGSEEEEGNAESAGMWSNYSGFPSKTGDDATFAASGCGGGTGGGSRTPMSTPPTPRSPVTPVSDMSGASSAASSSELASASASNLLPSGWEERVKHKEGQDSVVYYTNQSLGKRSWSRPVA